VLHGLEVSIDGAPKARVGSGVDVAMEARRLDIGLFGHEQEYVGLGRLGNKIKLIQDGASDILGRRVNDELRINVDER
jgi:hypothetical protein